MLIFQFKSTGVLNDLGLRVLQWAENLLLFLLLVLFFGYMQNLGLTWVIWNIYERVAEGRFVTIPKMFYLQDRCYKWKFFHFQISAWKRGYYGRGRYQQGVISFIWNLRYHVIQSSVIWNLLFGNQMAIVSSLDF